MSKRALTFIRVVGARPQFMQAAVLRHVLEAKGHREILVHTGQHYDDNMSKVFFEELNLPEPDFNLNVGGLSHGAQTGMMLERVEKVLLENPCDAVVVDGDTNSTLAGALAAAKLHIPVVHVEAGMRSYNKAMPEEVNRVLTDHMSTFCFCPSEVSRRNLEKEGIVRNVNIVGDLLADCFYSYRPKAEERVDSVYKTLGLNNKFALITMHRQENVDDKAQLEKLLLAISKSPVTVIWPIHPRTENRIKNFGLHELVQKAPFKLIGPLGYLEILALEKKAHFILTDSGGVQREAYHWGVPCHILRKETEWVEIVESGWARMFPMDGNVTKMDWAFDTSNLSYDSLYGRNDVAGKIVDLLEGYLL